MDEYYRLRRITNEKYNIFDKKYVRILNIFQAAFYISEGVELWDCYPGKDRKTGEPIAIFVFKREETKEVFDRWCSQRE